MLRSALLHAVPHGFTGRAEGDLRRGNAVGLSEVGAALGAVGGIRTASQVHGREILVVEGLGPTPVVEADAVLSTTAGVAVAVRVADCVPVLVASAAGHGVIAIHAGWRGTAADIVRVGVTALRSALGAPNEPLCAAIGPSIRSCCYEVGDEVVEGIRAVSPGDGWLDGRAVDLAEANRLVLASLGIPVEIVGGCTRCAGPWFSHRGGDVERQLGVIRVAT
ncbi:MAG: laccase domain-containing protein [Myxococcales bacterium]|nr:laccase domain-containing protein [Myxococcales bacterium]